MSSIRPWSDYFINSDHKDLICSNWGYGCMSKQAGEFNLCVKTQYTSGEWKTPITKDMVKALREEFEALRGHLIVHAGFGRLVYIWDRGMAEVEGDVDLKLGATAATISIVTTDDVLFDSLAKIAEKYIKTLERPEGRVFVLLPDGRGGLDSEPLGVGGIPIIKDNYLPNVVAGYDRIVADLKRGDPLGRIVLLDGPPGTGKTYLIRGLLNDLPDLKFLLLPSNMISSMTGPELLAAVISAAKSNNKSSSPNVCPPELFSTLEDGCDDDYSNKKKQKPVVLVVEDADSCLTTRGSDNMGALSSLLNISDGIIGNLLDLRIICTTNAEIEHIDEAILRTGRLSARVEIGLLNREQAKAAYERLGGKKEVDWSVKKMYPLSDIYALVKGLPEVEEQFNSNSSSKRKVGFAA